MQNNGQGRNRLRDMAFLVPCLGLFLFSPLILGVVRNLESFVGLPSLPVFIFFAWMMLIIASFLISRRIKKTSNEQTPSRKND